MQLRPLWYEAVGHWVLGEGQFMVTAVIRSSPGPPGGVIPDLQLLQLLLAQQLSHAPLVFRAPPLLGVLDDILCRASFSLHLPH